MSKLFRDTDKRDLFMTLLKVMGGRKAKVSFDGSGDSGNIEAGCLLDQDGKEIDISNATFDWYENRGEFDTTENKWVKSIRPLPNMPVADILVNICEEALEQEGLDWYNNDGGYGELHIDLTTTPPLITMNVSIRVTSTDDYDYDYTDYDDGEGKDASISS